MFYVLNKEDISLGNVKNNCLYTSYITLII